LKTIKKFRVACFGGKANSVAVHTNEPKTEILFDYHSTYQKGKKIDPNFEMILPIMKSSRNSHFDNRS